MSNFFSKIINQYMYYIIFFKFVNLRIDISLIQSNTLSEFIKNELLSLLYKIYY